MDAHRHLPMGFHLLSGIVKRTVTFSQWTCPLELSVKRELEYRIPRLPEFHQNSPESRHTIELEHLKKGDDRNSASRQVAPSIRFRATNRELEHGIPSQWPRNCENG